MTDGSIPRSILGDLRRGYAYTPPVAERRRARERVSQSLPLRVRALPHQWLGQRNAGCGATHGVLEACDFSCTACYLAPTAQKTPPLPFEEVKAQLDALREHLGPGGNVQLTAGEVTLMPAEDLARIVAYARRVGLDPMVMTNGQTLLRDPGYLDTLRRAGLQKLSIHVDSTQRGRDGYERGATEDALHEVRRRFADLVRDSRRRLDAPLHAAHTVTVTPENLGDVPSIVRFTTEHADAFRLISLQPTADVGRTRAQSLGADALWAQVERGVGQRLNASTFHFGHPACNRVSLFFVVRYGEQMRAVEVARENARVDSLFLTLLERSGARHLDADDCRGAEAVGRALALLGREPWLAAAGAGYGLYRAATERRWLWEFARAWRRGERCSVHPFSVVVHDFMGRDDLLTDEGRERLASCCFRVPVEGRMVSMCELNATGLRERLNRQQRRLVTLRRSET